MTTLRRLTCALGYWRMRWHDGTRVTWSEAMHFGRTFWPRREA